jgi:hypothetical protein
VTTSEKGQMQSMQALKDPEFYQWHFFLRWHSRESKDQWKEHEQSFITVLKEALNWVGEPFTTQYSTLSNVIPLQVSERLATADWHERHNGVLRNLEARSMLDIFYIQVGQERQGVYQPNVFSSFVKWVPTTLDSESARHIYMGEAVCLCAEVKGGLPKDKDRDALIAKIVEAAGEASLPLSRPEGIPLEFGFLIPLPAAKQDTFVLLYSSSQISRVGRFVHYMLPQLLLSRQKALYIVREYHRSMLPKAQEQEQLLDSLMKQASKSKISLEQLEQLSTDISRQQASFIEILSVLEDWLNTMRVNLHNVELLLRDSVWKDEQQTHQQLTDIITLQIKQMETDLCYLNTTQKQADLVLQSLHTLVGVRETRWGRRITVLLGLFGITGIISVFQDILQPWYWRFIALLAGVAIIYLLIQKVKGE